MNKTRKITRKAMASLLPVKTLKGISLKSFLFFIAEIAIGLAAVIITGK